MSEVYLYSKEHPRGKLHTIIGDHAEFKADLIGNHGWYEDPQGMIPRGEGTEDAEVVGDSGDNTVAEDEVELLGKIGEDLERLLPTGETIWKADGTIRRNLININGKAVTEADLLRFGGLIAIPVIRDNHDKLLEWINGKAGGETGS